MHKQCQQVAHRSRWNKERSFLAQHLCSELLQPIQCWIITIDVIAYFSFCHCFPHFGRWLGHGIRTEVDVFHEGLLREYFPVRSVCLKSYPTQQSLASQVLSKENNLKFPAVGIQIKRSRYRAKRWRLFFLCEFPKGAVPHHRSDYMPGLQFHFQI